ncbi:choice-of-anchor L domain-containing protein [Inhella proteolytica]|uniref:Choice-of-anchor L domain-containing protein n=1 Tax=Inhella proteolytica TaxID=2795029 RepID=A0A931J4U9_9BURK|nr:choice-of-anchor L domain-containing protein [Inhella proteolytica]MBH9578245.1 choice-of-anchor L domain-containing protein [Inhella proteolytica]
MKSLQLCLGAIALSIAGLAQAVPVVTASTDANALANAIGGAGITISNAQLITNGTGLNNAAGLFSSGAGTVGFDKGILLTTGTVDCAGQSNTSNNCGQNGGAPGGAAGNDTVSLKFDFSSSTGNVFFRYVFASEEYNEYVNAGVNDAFQLLLNGTNIALLPGSGQEVSIDNVNCLSNTAHYRNNRANGPAGCTSLNLDIQYDGLTTVLTASGTGLTGTNSFEFKIFDRGDNIYDSAVFIQAGSFSGTNDVPLPGTLALAGLGLMGLGFAQRRKA